MLHLFRKDANTTELSRPELQKHALPTWECLSANVSQPWHLRPQWQRYTGHHWCHIATCPQRSATSPHVRRKLAGRTQRQNSPRSSAPDEVEHVFHTPHTTNFDCNVWLADSRQLFMKLEFKMLYLWYLNRFSVLFDSAKRAALLIMIRQFGCQRCCLALAAVAGPFSATSKSNAGSECSGECEPRVDPISLSIVHDFFLLFEVCTKHSPIPSVQMLLRSLPPRKLPSSL